MPTTRQCGGGRQWELSLLICIDAVQVHTLDAQAVCAIQFEVLRWQDQTPFVCPLLQHAIPPMQPTFSVVWGGFSYQVSSSLQMPCNVGNVVQT